MNTTFKQFQFQTNAINQLLNLSNETNRKEILMQAPTGAGKTVILCKYIERYLAANSGTTAFIWLTPGAAEMEEQSKKKFDKYVPQYRSNFLDDVLTSGFGTDSVSFINWEALNKDDNIALREGEKANIKDRIRNFLLFPNHKFIILIDEAHLNDTEKTETIIKLFGENVLKIKVSATMNKKVDIDIKEDDVIREGLITKFICINENIGENNNGDERDILFNQAIIKQEEIKNAYKALNKDILPLIIVQLSNDTCKGGKKGAAQKLIVTETKQYLADKGYTVGDGTVAVWTANEQVNINDDHQPLDTVKFLITKQAIATGWDCPRAKILIKLRDSSSETFEIQVLGRIRRMPEQKHYQNEILNNCYLYTFDTEYKDAVVKAYGNTSTHNVLPLKSKYRNLELNLKKEKLEFQANDNQREIQTNFINAFIKKYGLINLDEDCSDDILLHNRTNLELGGYNFSEEQIILIAKGNVTTTAQLNTVNKQIIKNNILSAKALGEKYKTAQWDLHVGTQIEQSLARSIISLLFETNKKGEPSKAYRFSNVPLYHNFIINNISKIINDLVELKNDLGYMNQQSVSENDFAIPNYQNYLLGNTNLNEIIRNKNIFKNYSNHYKHSIPENIFENWCEDNSAVQWVYKNGDKGEEFLSIVYFTGDGKGRLFYPDYITSINNQIYLIETKGGINNSGQSSNIDNFAELKFKALKQYADRNNVKFAFVRPKTLDGVNELYYNNTEYTELTDTNWSPIDQLC